jgi:hypothetical protein
MIMIEIGLEITTKTKNFLFAAAVLSLALASGCAKGGNGVFPTLTVNAPNGVSTAAIYPTQSVTFTATTTDPAGAAVTWSLTGTGCTGSSNPCGTIGASSGIYQAPSAAISGVIVTATLASDSAVTGTQSISVINVTTAVSPGALNVGSGLSQQFTAVALPNDAPQTFTWTCTANGSPCSKFTPAPGVSSAGPALYTAADSCTGNCVQISAASTLDPTACSGGSSCTSAAVSLINSRVNGAYAFRFSGYDASNNAVAVVGTFTASNGTITSGFEDETTSSGTTQHSITAGSYAPTASDKNNSNNAGTLTLTTGASPNKFQAVLDGAGDIEMIESDGNGSGSGIAQQSGSSSPFKGAQTFAFGLTGVDSSGKRIGYAGVLTLSGSAGGTITGGQVDVNDNGTAHSYSSVAGSYTSDGSVNSLWHVTNLQLTSGTTIDFDFFLASATNTKTSPLTFYMISTDTAATGAMVLQDSTQTYNTAAFDGTSVSALTGVNGANTNVSLTLGSTDGNGGFSGQFDQNNAGTILSSIQFPGSSTSYTYAASGTGGRYTFNMLGDPATSAAPLPFILYASGANRGFLLDQSSASVMTGTMNPQGKGGGILSGSEITGTFAAATTRSGNSAVDPLAANLLLTWANTGTCTSECVNGTLYDTANPAGVPLTGANPAYSLQATGNGTIALTAPSTESYVIYVIDTSGTCTFANPACAIQDFLMIDETPANLDPSIIFARQ